MHFSIDRTVHTTAFDKPVVDHWLKRKITQTAAGSTEKDRSDDQTLQRRARYQLSYIHKEGMDGWMDRLMDGWKEGGTDEWMVGWMDGGREGQMD